MQNVIQTTLEIATPDKLEPIQQKTLVQAMRMLDAIGAVYAIQDPTGEVHGELQVAEPQYRRNLRYEFGSIAAYLSQYLPQLGVGAIARVPLGAFDHVTLTRSCAAMMNKLHGPGSYKTHYDAEKNIIEVIRYS